MSDTHWNHLTSRAVLLPDLHSSTRATSSLCFIFFHDPTTPPVLIASAMYLPQAATTRWHLSTQAALRPTITAEAIILTTALKQAVSVATLPAAAIPTSIVSAAAVPGTAALVPAVPGAAVPIETVSSGHFLPSLHHKPVQGQLCV